MNEPAGYLVVFGTGLKQRCITLDRAHAELCAAKYHGVWFPVHLSPEDRSTLEKLCAQQFWSSPSSSPAAQP
jgi:hypothetical protein